MHDILRFLIKGLWNVHCHSGQAIWIEFLFIRGFLIRCGVGNPEKVYSMIRRSTQANELLALIIANVRSTQSVYKPIIRTYAGSK